MASTAIILLQVISTSAQQNKQQTRLTIDELFNIVETSSKPLQVQRSSSEMAQAAIKTAEAQRLPDINTSLTFSYLGDGFTTDRNFSDYEKAAIPHYGNNFALEAQQVVYSGGAISSGIELAKLNYRQSQITTDQKRQQVRFIALGQYLNLYMLSNQIKVYEQNISLTNRLIDNVRARQQQGTALKNDITRYELQLENLNLGLTKVRNEISIQNHQLCTTLNLPSGTEILPDTAIIAGLYPTDGEAYWQNNATTSSPILKQAAIDKDKAKVNEKIVHSDMLPKIVLVAADHLDGPITIEVPPINRNFNYWYVGVGISYNISSLFKSNKKLNEARIATRQSEESYASATDDVENSVQSAYTLYQQSFIEWHTQQKSVELASQNYNTIRERYINQLALVTDMTDAANVKLSAELQEVNARIGIVYAYYKMKYISGNL